MAEPILLPQITNEQLAAAKAKAAAAGAAGGQPGAPAAPAAVASAQPQVGEPISAEALQGAKKAEALRQQLLAAQGQQKVAESNAPGGMWDKVKDTAADVAKSAGSGLLRGVVGAPGAPGDIAALGLTGVNRLTRALRGETYEQQQARQRAEGQTMPEDIAGAIGSDRFNRMAAPYTGGATTYEPKTTAGRVAQGVGEFLPGAVIPGQALSTGGKLAARGGRAYAGVSDAVRFGALPYAASEGAGAAARLAGADPDTQALMQGGAGALAGLAATYGTNPQSGKGLIGQNIEEGGGPARAAGEMTKMGPEGMVLDTGPGAQGTAMVLARQPGKAQTIIRDALNEREATRPTRVRAELDDVLGTPRETFAADTAKLLAEKAVESKRNFDEARSLATRADTTAVVQDLTDRLKPYKTPNNAGAREATGWANDAESFRRSIAAAKGDYTQLRALYSDMRATLRDHKTPDAFKNAVGDATELLAKSLDDATKRPDGSSAHYDARTAHRAASEHAEARERGTKLLEKGEDADQLALDIKGMSDLEKRGLVAGLRKNLDVVMDHAYHDASTGSRKIDTTATLDKLQVLEDAGVLRPGSTKRLQGMAESSLREKGTFDKVLNNSVTSAVELASKRVPNADAPVVPQGTTLYGDLRSGALKAVDAVLGAGTRKGRTNATIDAAEALVGKARTDPERLALTQALEKAYRGDTSLLSKMTGGVGRAAAAGGASYTNEDSDRQPLVIDVRKRPRRQNDG